MPRTIAIFGGAFDPVHLDHIAIGRSVADLGLGDEVWYVPSPDRWDKRLFASAEHRLAMLRIAVGDDPRLVVSDLEIRMGEFRGTYEFLKSLSEASPCDEFRLVIGADSYASIPKWRDPLSFYGTEFNGCRLLSEFSLIIYARNGFALPDAETHLANSYKPFHAVGVPEGFLGILASSDIRERLLHPDRDAQGLDPRVLEYIRAQGLYLP